MSKNTGKFLLGALVGAGVALMFAPKSGKELRKDLKNKFEELKARINEVETEDIKDLITNKIATIEEDIANLDKETILKVAKEKALLIEEKLEDLIVAAGKAAKPALTELATDVKKRTVKALKATLKKLEENTNV